MIPSDTRIDGEGAERDPRRYRLAVPEGTYESDTLIGLVAEVLRHRAWHLLRGEGWRD